MVDYSLQYNYVVFEREILYPNQVLYSNIIKISYFQCLEKGLWSRSRSQSPGVGMFLSVWFCSWSRSRSGRFLLESEVGVGLVSRVGVGVGLVSGVGVGLVSGVGVGLVSGFWSRFGFWSRSRTNVSWSRSRSRQKNISWNLSRSRLVIEESESESV